MKTFFTKLKLHEARELGLDFMPQRDAPATPAIRTPYKTRKARRAARNGDTGQHPKPLAAARKRKPATYERDAAGCAITRVGKGFTRHVWLGGLSAISATPAAPHHDLA